MVSESETNLNELEELTESGVAYRMHAYYLPKFQEFLDRNHVALSEARVLDCGCGNGVSIELLAEAGIQGFGIDTWPLKKQQWKQRGFGSHTSCLFGDATRLPFDDRSFNIVFSCGLLEHIGVYEEWEPAYRARPSPNQFEERKGFLAECLRVLRQPGVLYIDHPNGAFPLDFWHYTGHTGFRPHSPSEGFLPDFNELVQLLCAAGWKGSIEAISPAGRFEFKQVGRRWWGRFLTWPAKGLLNLISQPGFARLARSPLNPYLVVRVENV